MTFGVICNSCGYVFGDAAKLKQGIIRVVQKDPPRQP